MLRAFLNSLRGTIAVTKSANIEVQTVPSKPISRDRDWVTSEEYVIVGLQRVEDNSTQITVKINGERKTLLFPGLISETYFLLLLQQKVQWTSKNYKFSTSVDSFSGRDVTLEVLSGELTGQQFVGKSSSVDIYL